MRKKFLGKEKIQKNKFYVGSNKVFESDWGHQSLPKAIEHAEKLLNSELESVDYSHRQNYDELVIVKIVRIVRRKPMPVEVETVS